MGFDDLLKEGEGAIDGQTAANDETKNQASGSGHEAAENTLVDSVVDEVASKEGLSAAFDPEVNNIVNDEVDKL